MESLRELALAAYGGKEPKRMKSAITLDIGIKRCCRCREWKRLDQFGPSNSRPDGFDNKCRPCVREYLAGWHARPENADKYREYTRRSRYADEAARRRTAENRLRDRCKAYGITAEKYREMLAEQGGGCAICGRTPEQNGRALAIDHDHRCCPDELRSCGRCVRGLLCSPCNVAVGYFESEKLMKACEEYVSKASAP